MTFKRQAEFVDIVGDHRIPGEPRVENGWAVWDCGHSAPTMAKFVQRAKRRGFRSAFFRPGRFGVRVEHLEA